MVGRKSVKIDCAFGLGWPDILITSVRLRMLKLPGC